jgi:heat shock protein HtpX
LALTFLVVFAVTFVGKYGAQTAGYGWNFIFDDILALFVEVLPWVLGGVAVWFVVAYLFNTQIINNAVHSQPLERRDNKRIYNMVENLTMAAGMPMPQINIIDTPALNAFASGINQKTYTVTLTTGIIEALSDDELEGVIAHELTHIRNRDVRVLIVSIVFVGIFSLIMSLAFRSALHMRGGKNSGAVRGVLFLVAIAAAVGVLFSSLTKFAISRKREFMADAGAAEMTRKPLALAGALRRISGRSAIPNLDRADVAQLFIDTSGPGSDDSDSSDFSAGLSGSSGFSALFATHPPIDQRIAVLEQF